MSQRSDYYDWTITCAFYFVIHCVEAYAHKIKLEGKLKHRDLEDEESLHKIRERFVREKIPQHYAIYMNLYKKSRKSRYDPTYFEKIAKNIGYQKRLLESAQKIKEILR